MLFDVGAQRRAGTIAKIVGEPVNILSVQTCVRFIQLQESQSEANRDELHLSGGKPQDQLQH
jgi:hypothetical protein